MESYIVRVYHRDEQDPALVDGVVEIVVTGEKLAFHDSGELWRILAPSDMLRLAEPADRNVPAAAAGACRQALA